MSSINTHINRFNMDATGTNIIEGTGSCNEYKIVRPTTSSITIIFSEPLLFKGNYDNKQENINSEIIEIPVSMSPMSLYFNPKKDPTIQIGTKVGSKLYLIIN